MLTREVQARIEAAEAEVSRGEYAEYDESELHLLARDIHERGLKKIAAERDKNNSSE